MLYVKEILVIVYLARYIAYCFSWWLGGEQGMIQKKIIKCPSFTLVLASLWYSLSVGAKKLIFLSSFLLT